MERDEIGKIKLTVPLKIFLCYSRKDGVWRDELEKHLEPLRRSGQVTTWYDREILPGMEWKLEIDKQLNVSDVVLLLVSPNFIRSDYCYGIEMQRALERHKAKEAHVILIILRPVDWEHTPIHMLQALPTGGKPILTWRNRDEAFKDVARGLDKVVKVLLLEKISGKSEDQDFWFEEWYEAYKRLQEIESYKDEFMDSIPKEAYQQLQELDRLKDAFMISASHELRTPLTAVQGYLELLELYGDSLSPEQLQGLVKKASHASEELVLLLNNFLDASRMDVGQFLCYLHQIMRELRADLEQKLVE